MTGVLKQQPLQCSHPRQIIPDEVPKYISTWEVVRTLVTSFSKTCGEAALGSAP